MTEPPVHGPPFAGYQAEIFLLGMGGTRPEHPISIDELERLAEERIEDPRAFDYVRGGAGRETTCARTSTRSGAGGSCRGCSATSRRATWR